MLHLSPRCASGSCQENTGSLCHTKNLVPHAPLSLVRIRHAAMKCSVHRDHCMKNRIDPGCVLPGDHPSFTEQKRVMPRQSSSLRTLRPSHFVPFSDLAPGAVTFWPCLGADRHHSDRPGTSCREASHISLPTPDNSGDILGQRVHWPGLTSPDPYWRRVNTRQHIITNLRLGRCNLRLMAGGSCKSDVVADSTGWRGCMHPLIRLIEGISLSIGLCR